MTQPLPRHRVLCIRPRLNPDAGPILTITSDEWVEALGLHAEVFQIEDDFDLDAICEQVRPDIMVLDAVNWTRPWPLTITNARARPEIPRVLFLNSDPHDPMRTLTMRMAHDLGIDTVFMSGEAYRQHMPELRHFTCFFTPQFIDDGIYRDYGLPKTIPVSVFGAHLLPTFYAWRAQLVEAIQHAIPTLVYPHPGYEKGNTAPFAVSGEAYARLLNQSSFSIADTTRLDYGVRKHLEIPASGSILVAPASDALASYGFVDMQNCVLGSGPELLGKIDLVARAPFEYQRIRDAGMAMVQKRFTRRNWRLMLDWLECRSRLKPGQVVQQIGRYGPFRCLTPTASTVSVMAAPQSDSDMTAALRAVQAAILSGDDLAGAAATIGQAASWVGHIAEPHFLMGMLALLKGDPIEAAMAIGRRPQAQGGLHVSLGTLDPVETAWLLLIARLIANPELESAMRDQARMASHVSLRRVFWLIDGAEDEAELSIDLVLRQPDDLPSVHWLGDEDFTLWCDLVRRVFRANSACPRCPCFRHAVPRRRGVKGAVCPAFHVLLQAPLREGAWASGVAKTHRMPGTVGAPPDTETSAQAWPDRLRGMNSSVESQ